MGSLKVHRSLRFEKHPY